MAAAPTALYATAVPLNGLHDRWEDGWVVLIAHVPCPGCAFPTARVLGGSFGSLGGHWLSLRCDSVDCAHEFRQLPPARDQGRSALLVGE